MTEHSPRERMVFAAVQSLREQGVAATGLREVVARADAPRGSLQHYFPGGKDQLVGEAIAWSGAYAARVVRAAAAGLADPTPGALFAALVARWRADYRRTDFARGCPLLAATTDVAATSPVLRESVSAAFDAWHRALREELRGMGVPAARARALATVMLTALEGALALARARRDLGPLDTVARELRPLLDAGQGPATSQRA